MYYYTIVWQFPDAPAQASTVGGPTDLFVDANARSVAFGKIALGARYAYVIAPNGIVVWSLGI